MSTKPTSHLHIASFLVRLQWEQTTDQRQIPARLYGVVEHVQSGERWPLTDLAELPALIQAKLTQTKPVPDE